MLLVSKNQWRSTGGKIALTKVHLSTLEFRIQEQHFYSFLEFFPSNTHLFGITLLLNFMKKSQLHAYSGQSSKCKSSTFILFWNFFPLTHFGTILLLNFMKKAQLHAYSGLHFFLFSFLLYTRLERFCELYTQ